jgi:hypothetical protein
VSVDCSLCHDVVLDSEGVASCRECRALFHVACEQENGGCGTYGCSHIPPPEAQASAVAPPTVWGTEVKVCPACDTEIRAAALRCRNCGVTFESAAPQTQEEYRRGERLKRHVGRLNRGAPFVFIAGIVPLLAPLALGIGGPFVLVHRRALATTRPIARTMISLGLGFAGLWAVLAGIALAAR